MRGARFLLAVCAALALSGCVHEQYAQQPSPRAAAPAPPARHLYSTLSGLRAAGLRAAGLSGRRCAARGRRRSRPVQFENAPRRFTRRAPPSPPPPAVGGPYVAATSSYASAPAAVVDGGGEPSGPTRSMPATSSRRGVRPGRHHQQLHRRRRRQGQPAVDRRGDGARLSPTSNWRTRSPRGSSKVIVREPHVSVEVETYRPFFHPRRSDDAGTISLRRQHDRGNGDRHRRRLCAARVQDDGGAHAQGRRAADSARKCRSIIPCAPATPSSSRSGGFRSLKSMVPAVVMARGLSRGHPA